MAIHTQLPIYRVAEDLLDVVADLACNMRRNFKRLVGEKIASECVEVMVLVFRANVARDKGPHLATLIERLQTIEMMLRHAERKHLISRAGYARAIELTTSIGKQANGWQRAAVRPHHGGQGRHD
jgi:hypothetical protein